MKWTKDDLDLAVKEGIIKQEQAERLWTFLSGRKGDPHAVKKSRMVQTIYYFGGLILLASMSWFLTNAWQNGVELLLISLLFGLLYLFGGSYLYAKGFEIPGGLLVTAAVGLVPVAIYGLQQAMGWWPPGEAPEAYRQYHMWVKSNWFAMEGGTILAALAALRFFSFPFLTFPLALSLWYMSMDLTPLLFGQTSYTWDQSLWVSLIFGLLTIAAAYVADLRIREKDYAFWLYLYGALAFWGGLSLMHSDNELTKFGYCLVNAGLIFFSVFIRRNIFMVLGGLGVFLYIYDLASGLFLNSYFFPLVLSFIGLLIIYIGFLYQKHKNRLEAFVERLLPGSLLKWRPPCR